MKNKKIYVGGIVFIIYSFLLLVRGCLQIESPMYFDDLIYDFWSIIEPNIIYPFILCTMGIIVFLLLKNKKSIIIYITTIIVQYIIKMFSGIPGFIEAMQDYNSYEPNTNYPIDYVVDTGKYRGELLISATAYAFEVIASLIVVIVFVFLLVSIIRIIVRKKNSNLYNISTILIFLRAMLEALFFILFDFSGLFGMDFIEFLYGLFNILQFVALFIAINLLGKELNAELKSNSILQE